MIRDRIINTVYKPVAVGQKVQFQTVQWMKKISEKGRYSY